MQIVQRLSRTAYRMREVKTGREFERTVSNINPYRASGSPADVGPVSSQADTDYKVSDLVAVEESKEIWIAQIISSDAETLDLHYWGTQARGLSAVFKPCYVGSRTGKTILSYHLRKAEGGQIGSLSARHLPVDRKEKEVSTRWTGRVPKDCIIGKIALDVRKRGKRNVMVLSRVSAQLLGTSQLPLAML